MALLLIVGCTEVRTVIDEWNETNCPAWTTQLNISQ